MKFNNNKSKQNIVQKENIVLKPAYEAQVNQNSNGNNAQVLIFKEYQKELLKKMNRANSFEKVKQVQNQSYEFK